MDEACGMHCGGNGRCILDADKPHDLHICDNPECWCHTPGRYHPPRRTVLDVLLGKALSNEVQELKLRFKFALQGPDMEKIKNCVMSRAALF